MTPTTLLLLVTGCMMLQPLSTDLYLASLPGMALDFGVTAAAVQQTLSLFVFGFGTAQLVSGPLSDRYGRRPVLIGGLALYLLSGVACALSPSLDWLITARFVQAIGCCTAVVVARAIVRDAYSPAEGARVMARALSLLALAPILGPILGGYLQISFGWRAAFVTLALAGLAMWVASMRHLTESNKQLNPAAMRPASLARAYLGVVRTPAFWAYALPGSLSYASIFVYISGTPFVLIKVLGVPTQYYGYLFAFGVCGYLGGTLICRRLIGRIGIARVLALGTTIGLAGSVGFLLLVLAGISHWTLVVTAQFVVMMAHGINFPCAQSGSLAPFPEKAGAAAGLFGCATMYAAWLIGTWVGSSLDDTLLPLASISAVVGVILFIGTRLLARYGEVD
ncbi:MAG: multidrug effflux MFS transporter [Burkholderiaceae bacterium]|nr:multidrug effflux MFS transporter [Sulfuritalea sp.]MCF8175186.1 multidrug effflux MFS transporter [Burkholderiaceae bacterium]MCF8184183.1 multidrug effflux MFS transporter [Polynucleobacter sp.]